MKTCNQPHAISNFGLVFFDSNYFLIEPASSLTIDCSRHLRVQTPLPRRTLVFLRRPFAAQIFTRPLQIAEQPPDYASDLQLATATESRALRLTVATLASCAT